MRPATRVFVYGFLAFFLACGLLGVELWPFSGFRLFSRVRTDQVRGWDVTTVDPLGSERVVPFAELPEGYRDVISIASGLARAPDGDRLEVCRAWASAAPGSGPDIVEVRVYATFERLSQPRRGWRELRYSCNLRGQA